ncbi:MULTISPECIES: pyruvate kinase [unclassified Synechococcus]|uniref:pyruvate kinase n=1 Tax=unclassified Synechococcus TaxID=2626047 RepID=UPI001C249DE6
MKDPTPAPAPWLLDTLRDLRATLERIEVEEAACLEAIHPDHRASARNLLHAMAFHRHAHPGLPKALRHRGLSPLTDGDAPLLASLEAVITALEALEGLGPSAAAAQDQPGGPPGLGGPDLLGRRCDRLFGALAPGVAGLMVTLPAEAAKRPALVADLLAAGMTIARIDCAHDDPAVWGRMVEALRAARAASGRPCAIAMDLAGPQLRTGQLAPQPAVIRARPPRDRMGRPTQPVRILAVSPGALPRPQDTDAVLLPARVSKAKRLKQGNRLQGRDASGRRRTLQVVRRGPDGVLLLQADKTCHFTSGLVFRQRHGKARLRVGPLAPVSGERLLRPGDAIRLTPEPDQGAGTLPCTLPEVFVDLRRGERVLFDDGRIGAVVRRVSAREVRLKVTTARARGSRLRSDKGIRFPDSDLRTPALTAKDIEDLAFVTRHADMVNSSFVHRESDIQTLRQCLEERGRGDLAVMLRIETRQAFLNLPGLLLAAMAHGAPVGVMIARSDLAIECGWESLAPIQEEILRICGAAHVPCLWATVTVLEGIGARTTADPSQPLLTCLAFRSNCEGGNPLP